jgi:hypothetical protein
MDSLYTHALRLVTTITPDIISLQTEGSRDIGRTKQDDRNMEQVK